MNKLISKHRGSAFLDEKENASPLGKAVADLLGHLFLGLYHLDPKEIANVEWSNPHHIYVKLRTTLATWDFNHLTNLVVLCHDLCLRCEIRSVNQQFLGLLFHARERDGGFSERHPTMEDHIKELRSFYQVEENNRCDALANNRRMGAKV